MEEFVIFSSRQEIAGCFAYNLCVQIPPSPPPKNKPFLACFLVLKIRDLNLSDGGAWGTFATAACGRKREQKGVAVTQ